jgi:hypothetical protein
MANPHPTPKPENLTPWKPGQPGNPKGHSRGRRMSAELWRLIDDRNALEALATVWLTKALQGNYPFFRDLLERLDGPTLGEAMKLELTREKQAGNNKGLDLAKLVGSAEQLAKARSSERDKGAGD